MLQTIREKSTSKIFYVLLMFLMIGGLLFFGVGDYSFGGSQPYVAKVGKEIISESEFARRVDENRTRMRQMMGEAYNAKMFDTPDYRRQLLEQMIDEELITQAGAAAGMAISDAKVNEEIGKITSFHTAGKFDNALYLQVLQANNLTHPQFKERIRSDLSLRELPSQINSTALVTDADVDTFLRLRDQLRSFRYVILPVSAPAPDSITDEAIKQYFDAHSIEYSHPEQVSVEYVEIDGAALGPVEPPSEQELRDYYETQLHRYGTKEQRLASHVLIELPENADADAEKQAKQKIDALAAEINAGKTFAEVATQSSDDIGSKAAGGDLGWIESGSMEPAFEAALFALEAGQVSAPVRSAQGYHLIEAREIRPAALRSFDDVRAELDAELVEDRRVTRFSDLQDKLYDTLDQTSGTLEPVAKAVGMEVQKSDMFSRDFGMGIALSPDVREAAFSVEVKEDGLSSEPIQLGRERIAVLRLLERTAAKPKTLDEVKEAVRSVLLTEASTTASKEAGDAAFKRLLAGEALDVIATSVGATTVDAADTGRQGLTHDAVLVAEAFKVARPAENSVSNALVKLNDSGYALLQIYAVVEGDPGKLDEAARSAARDQLKQELAATEAEAFRKALRASVPIRIDESKI